MQHVTVPKLDKAQGTKQRGGIRLTAKLDGNWQQLMAGANQPG
jgi:hypothetical protein